MITIDYNTRKVLAGKLWQYDYGQALRFQGGNLHKAQEIHFSLEETEGDSITRIGVTKDGVTDVVIPDMMLENNDSGVDYPVYVFIYNRDTESGETVDKFVINVLARSKPEHTVGSNDGDTFGKVIEEVNNAAERVETAEKKAGQHAEQTKLDAQQTTADLQEVKKLVESVSGIPEQVQIVKEYKEQAQTAATNALLSEQKSNEAKEVALQAQAGAETAEGLAEQHALEVAGDKVEVERLATQVRQDKAAVEQTKTAVDKTAQDFTLTAQQAVADVNNAGQSQTERVQVSGTTAVENIKTAQGAATQAVETARVEAVKEVQAEGTTQVGKVTEEGTKQLGILQAETAQFAEDRQQIQTNREDIADLRQHKADAIIETASGTMINIKDSANSYFEDFSMLGKTEQVQTTGAQILNCYKLAELEPKYYSAKQGKLKVMNDNGNAWSTTQEYGTLAAGTYTITANSFEIRDAVNNTQIATCFNSHTTFTLDKDTVVKMKIGFGLKEYPCAVDAMLNKGDKPLQYEPYTGGKPSPNQNDPQEIANAGGNGQIEVQVTGKNLFDINSEKDGFITGSGYIQHVGLANNEKYGEYIKINQFESICITTNVTVPSTEGASPWCGIAFYDKDKNFIVRQSAYAKVLQTKIPENAFYAIGTYRKYADGVLQIECGTVSTAYEPYREPQIVTITLDNPLTRWDKIEKREGVWGIVGKSRKITLRGNEKWRMYKDKAHTFSCPNDFIIEDGLCTHYKTIGSDDLDAKTGIYLAYTVYVIVTDLSVNNVDEFKALLSEKEQTGTPLEIICSAQTETWEQLPEETQTALNSLHTNYPTTIISNSEDCEMEVTYVCDTKNYTDKKIEKLVNEQLRTNALLIERTV